MSMLPAQLGGLFGGSTLIIGGVTFALVLGGILLYLYLVVDPWGGNAWDAFADACHAIVDEEDADAIALIPYSEGPMIPKPAIYDRELMGGKGGYRTPDGDIIYVDGQGNGMFTLQGVDVILPIDPTEHAAAADPLKAWIAHKSVHIGEWIKVDREGRLIEAGEAVQSLTDETPAMDIPKHEGVAADGGYASDVHKKAHEGGMSLSDAKDALESEGLLHKIVDIAPPREAVIDEETGEVEIEEATHVAVDVSAAADLLPKKTNTTALQVMEERARQEGMDSDQRREDLLLGIVVGAAISGVIAVIIALVLGFT